MTVTAGFKGSQTDRLRALGKQFEAGADLLTQIRASTDRQLRELAWYGNDQRQFMNTWETTYAPALGSVADALRTAATNVAAQAEEQDTVSGTGNSTGTGSTAGTGNAASAGNAANAGSPAGAASAATPAGESGAGGGTASSGSAATPATGAGSERLGELSAQHESNGDPGAVSTGRGDHGGVSYGKYQIATGTGTAAEYVNWLKTNNPDYYERLAGLKAGGAEFKAAWQALSAEAPDAFAESQYQFIVQTHFEPAMAETYSRVPGFSLEGRSSVVAEMMFSTTVQHRMNTDVIVERALAGRDVAAMSDAEIITAIYNERGADNGAKYFPSSSQNVQQNVAARFEREKTQALAALGN